MLAPIASPGDSAGAADGPRSPSYRESVGDEGGGDGTESGSFDFA